MFYYTKDILSRGDNVILDGIKYVILSYEFRTNSQYCYILKAI